MHSCIIKHTQYHVTNNNQQIEVKENGKDKDQSTVIIVCQCVLDLCDCVQLNLV